MIAKKYKMAIDARPAQGEGSGVVTYSLNTIISLAELEELFDFVFIIDSKLDFSHIRFPANTQIISTAIGRGNWLLRDVWMQFILPRKLERMGVHLFHQLDYFVPFLPVKFVLVSTFLDAIAFTPHDDRNILSTLRVRELMKRGSKNADAIVTISEFSKQELLKHLDMEPKKIAAIWCGVSDNFFKASNPEVLSYCREKIGFNGRFILYYGGFIKRKNVELLLDAFKLVAEKKGIKLVLAGNVPMNIEQKIESLGLGNSVKCFGFAQEVELRALLEECALFVFPSNMEGFGLPVAEAMAAGAPVVCSRNGSLPEIGGSAVRYFDGTTPGDLATAILDVIDNKGLREELKKKGQQRAKQFSWARAAGELGELYLRLIKKKYPYHPKSCFDS